MFSRSAFGFFHVNLASFFKMTLIISFLTFGFLLTLSDFEDFLMYTVKATSLVIFLSSCDDTDEVEDVRDLGSCLALSLAFSLCGNAPSPSAP